MRNKKRIWSKRVRQNLERAKQVYDNFRLYDLGSYALNRLTLKKGYHIRQSIRYGDADRHTFDLYHTENPRKNRPFLLFVHGGAWSHGDKKDYQFIADTFAKKGFDVAVINYQLAPEFIFPTSVHDLALALNFITEQQQQLKVCLDEIVLLGHSAGAFNIMSLLYHPQPLPLKCQQNIKAVIGLAGPYHFDYKDDPLCADAFDQSVPYAQVMPYYFVKNNAIKHFLFVAQQDKIVHFSNAQDLDQQLKQVGNHSEIYIVPKVGHITIVGSISALFSRFYETKNMLLNVLDRTFPYV